MSARLSLVASILGAGLLACALDVTAAPAGSFVRRAPRGVAPTPADDGSDASLDKDVLAQSAAPARTAGAKSLAGPPFDMACGDVSLLLDGFGGFGSASAGGDALFDAGTGPLATVFEAMAHLRNAGFLDADSLALPQEEAHAARSGGSVTASYVRGPFRFDLTSRLVDCDDPRAATLRQAWSITNVSPRAQGLVLTLYVDGDMYFQGDHRDDFGVRTDDALWQFDHGDPFSPSAFVALTSEAPQALAITREVGEYADQRRRINRNLVVRDGLFRATGAPADADGDGVTDAGFDVSMAIAHDFGQVAPGATVALEGRIRWGVGSLLDVLPRSLGVDLGADRVVECEGREGTLVRVAAQAEPADRVASWSWSVDGLDVAGASEIDALLGVGEHDVVVRVTDAQGRVAEDALRVSVVDTTPPEAVVGADVVLWPPDHRMVEVALPVELRDACSDAVTLHPRRVECDEAPEARDGGDGMFATDSLIVLGRVYLRRERQGGGDGRVYLVHCDAVDAGGNVTPLTVTVRVPHDMGDGR